MSGLDLVDWPADRTLVVSGSPRALRIPLKVRNPGAAAPRQAQAALLDLRPAGGGEPIPTGYAVTQLNVPENGFASAEVRVRLDPATPPGRYEGRVEVGGASRTVTIEVLPGAKLEVRPDPLILDAAGRRDHELTAAFDNRGNVPLTIDLTGAYPLGEEVLLSPERTTEGLGDSLGGLFDRLLDRGAPALAPRGSAECAMPEGPLHLEPGAGATARVRVRLPTGLSPTARYHLVAPLYASELHIVIVTAAKPPAAAKPARQSKGAAA